MEAPRELRSAADEDEGITIARREYEGENVIVVDFGPDVDATVDVVDGTAIVVAGNRQFEFVSSGGSVDGPYLGGSGPVVNAGTIGVHAMGTTTTTTTTSTTTSMGTTSMASTTSTAPPTTTSTPGFTPLVAVLALLGAGLVLLRRRG